ncbi:hypothetical protein ON010_g9062 [Phytophthora cinnamomi]|nr:hypothetical protein ON010_g9062 [Phytophthora cinnamomi]
MGFKGAGTNKCYHLILYLLVSGHPDTVEVRDTKPVADLVSDDHRLILARGGQHVLSVHALTPVATGTAIHVLRWPEQRVERRALTRARVRALGLVLRGVARRPANDFHVDLVVRPAVVVDKPLVPRLELALQHDLEPRHVALGELVHAVPADTVVERSLVRHELVEDDVVEGRHVFAHMLRPDPVDRFSRDVGVWLAHHALVAARRDVAERGASGGDIGGRAAETIGDAARPTMATATRTRRGEDDELDEDGIVWMNVVGWLLWKANWKVKTRCKRTEFPNSSK